MATAIAHDDRPGRKTHCVSAIKATFLMLVGSALPVLAQAPITQFTGVSGPVGVALDTVSGTTYLYVADEAHGNVLKLNAATGATVATFGTGSQGTAAGQFGRPYGLAVDPTSHDLYVTERLNGRVQRINSTTGASVFMWGTNDAVFSASGQNTTAPNPTSPQGHFQEPIGIAADAAGNVYVVDHGNNRVQKFLVHQSGGVWTADNVTMWGTSGSGTGQFDHPYGAALDASGNLFVADGLNGRVQKFSSSGTYLSTIGSKGTGAGQFVVATWVGFSPGGALYVTSTNSDPQATSSADINNQWVSNFSADGTFVSRFGGTYGSNPGEFKLPFGIAIDAASRAYVSDYYNSRVQVFDLTTPPGGGTGGSPTNPAVSSFTIGATATGSVTFALTFNEAVTGVDASDFTLITTGGASGTVGALTGSGTSYNIPVTYSGTGTLQLSLKASGTGITDAAGHALTTGATSPVFTIPTGGGTNPASVAVVGATVPADGTYRAGDALVFKVRFSAPVFVKPAATDDSEDHEDESDAGGGPYITWTAVASPGGSADSGRAKYQSGSGTAELTFKYQVHGNDDAPAGIALATALTLPSGASITDNAGHVLAGFTIPWPKNPLPGVVLVRANASNHGADVRAGTPANGANGKNARLVNVSSRLHIKGNDSAHAAAVGFVVSGTSPQTVLVRAVGPGLRAFGVLDALAEPTLTIQDSTGKVVATNAGWNNDAAVANAAKNVGAFGLGPNSRDSALVVTLAPGAYTATVDASKGSGTVLVEVYDANGAGLANPELVNMSTRGFVDADSNLIVGFVVQGTAAKRVLVRAVGPGLATYGVNGTLPDPALDVRDVSGAVVARNDNWGTPQTADATHAPATAADIVAATAAAGGFPLTSGSKDAAVLVTLTPGAYTAVVSGATGTSGAVLVEVYETNP